MADALSKLLAQRDRVGDMEAVLPFASNNEVIFPIKLQQIQNTQGKDRSLRKRRNDNPTKSCLCHPGRDRMNGLATYNFSEHVRV